jgi:hypothetical protein
LFLTGDQERTGRDREEVRGVRGKEDGNTKEIERGFGFEVMFGESDGNYDRRDDGGGEEAGESGGYTMGRDWVHHRPRQRSEVIKTPPS